MRREEGCEENPDKHQALKVEEKEPNRETEKEPSENEYQGHRGHGLGLVCHRDMLFGYLLQFSLFPKIVSICRNGHQDHMAVTLGHSRVFRMSPVEPTWPIGFFFSEELNFRTERCENPIWQAELKQTSKTN